MTGSPGRTQKTSSLLLQLLNVSVLFPSRSTSFRGKNKPLRAVRSVSLEIHKGRALGLVGESGCGKSTLGRTALFLVRPSTGKVIFDGVDLGSLSSSRMRKLRRRMQMIFQDPRSSLNPRMRVAELVTEPLIIHEPKIGKADLYLHMKRLLEDVNLPSDAAQRYPHELSGGQRQRVAIARALSCGPELLVADEPTSALDVSVQAQIINVLAHIRKERDLAFLFISHNIPLVEIFCHDIAVMYLGEIVEKGSSQEIALRPLHPYTVALHSAMPSLDPTQPTMLSVHGEVVSPVDLPTGCVFHTRCPLSPKPHACFSVAPSLKEVLPGHFVACHLVQPDNVTRQSGASDSSDTEKDPTSAQ